MKAIQSQQKNIFISGANRGIGAALVREAFAQGAAKVYAGVRKLNSLSQLQEEFGDKLVPIQLDVTQPESIQKAVDQASDIDILINNAGVFGGGGFSEGLIEGLEENFAVNVYGVAHLTQGFLPHLKAKPEAAILTVSSMVGLASMPMGVAYSASKAAVHSLIQGLRGELKASNILISGIYPGPIDTEMLAGIEMEKDSPENVAQAVFHGISLGQEDIFPDSMAQQMGSVYLESPKQAEEIFSQFVGE